MPSVQSRAILCFECSAVNRLYKHLSIKKAILWRELSFGIDLGLYNHKSSLNPIGVIPKDVVVLLIKRECDNKGIGVIASVTSDLSVGSKTPSRPNRDGVFFWTLLS